MTPNEQMKYLQDTNPDEVKELLKQILNVMDVVVENQKENNKTIEKLKKSEIERLLESHENFDHSDIRLNFDDGLGNISFIMMMCTPNHIEIMTKSWIPEFRTLQNLIMSLNHEHLHAVIDKLLLQDGIDYRDVDNEFPLYAGGMDMLNGLSSTYGMATYYMDMETLRTTANMIPEFRKKLADVGDDYLF